MGIARPGSTRRDVLRVAYSMKKAPLRNTQYGLRNRFNPKEIR